ncbi:MAG: SDR family oxidoreductase, partial [Alphaproteobacteria bacterium]
MKGLKGKRVVVTAGASGIGRAIAHGFHARGGNVAVCDISREHLDTLQGEIPGIIAGQADVSDEAEVDAFFDHALAELGGIDVLVNNAGVSGPTGGIETLSLDDWKHCTAVNLDGCFLCCRRVVPLMKAQSGGVIINISSTAGILAYPMRAPYAAAKWAVVGLTKTLAMELGAQGIRVNSIAPGSINNARMDGVIARESAVKGVSEDEIRQSYVRQSAMRTL